MSFVVDGTDWAFDGWTLNEIEGTLTKLLERANVARERRERVYVGDDLQTRCVREGKTIWDLWSPDCQLRPSNELRQELTAFLHRAHLYADEELPAGMEDFRIGIDHGPLVDSSDRAWAHHCVRSGRAVACLGLRTCGEHTTRSVAGAVHVHWVTTEPEHRTFFRQAIDVERDSEKTLERMAPHAFPNICFHTNVWRDLSLFSGGYHAVRVELRKYLTILDDHGHWAFTCPPPTLSPSEPVDPSSCGTPPDKLIADRFSALGLDMSPEKPQVHADGRCRQAREVQIAGRVLYCEWHGKLERHQNRIHIHPPVPESDDRVVVAIFCHHLPLPGD